MRRALSALIATVLMAASPALALDEAPDTIAQVAALQDGQDLARDDSTGDGGAEPWTKSGSRSG